MADVLVWWLVVEMLGLAALPVAWRVFAGLPDRGYAFAKPLAIFLIAYVLWISGVAGLATNSRETILFILFVMAALSWLWAWRQGAAPAVAGQQARSQRMSAPGAAAIQSAGKDSSVPPIIAWLRDNAKLVAIQELIFACGIIVWALFKAYNPEIIATEKPMELAFLNGILRSEQFPPLDPWLSGFSISYYYFGYLMAAMLTRLSGVAPAVAFNLVQVLGFALTLTGSFSVVYNLVAHRSSQRATVVRSAVAAGVLAGLFVVILGNLEGFLEFFYAQGIGSPAFWKSLGIADLTQPYVSGTWYPTSNWWWWKASRVIGTPGAIGDYTINEFPFFSFMLGDNHPHVLALPYVLMAVALALGLLLSPHEDLLAIAAERRWSRLLSTWFFPALLLGGLFFLNSWDFPTYMLIAMLAYAFRSVRWRGKLDAAAVKEILLFALPMAVLGICFYLPFYLSFQSQANGFGLVRVRSQLHHFVLIFGVFLFITLGYLAVKFREWRSLTSEERRPASRLVPAFIIAALVAAAS